MERRAPDCWRWEEQSWRDPAASWRGARLLAGGVDVGSVSSQAAVLADDRLVAWSSVRTGHSSPDSARRAMSCALEGTELRPEDLHSVVGTGYGRVNVPFAHQTQTEILCHARGAARMWGGRVRTLLDMGGQDCKAIRCDGDGRVLSFQMNDKCAAGTGRGLEAFADLLQIPIQELGPLSLTVEDPPPISSTCVVFARSEASSLLRQGWSKERVLAAFCAAMARRVITLLERVGIEREFAVTGGIAKNPGVVKRIERGLGLEALPSPLDAQVAGALGAALHAQSLVRRG